MTMSVPLLRLSGITKRFPGVIALQNVTFEAYPGEVIALLGENGAGKSTLMKIIGGVYQPDEGQLEISGQPVVIRNVQDATKNGIAFVHQELNLLDNFDIGSNVFLGREPKRGLSFFPSVDTASIHARTQPFLDRLGLGISSRTPLAQLSLAQRQMVEIARALSLEARFLILDEPTSSLTLGETQKLFEVVHDLKREGVTVIYISHRLSEVAELCDRAVALRDGRNSGELVRAEMTHERMIAMMVGRNLERVRRKTSAVEVNSPGPPRLEVRNLRTQRFPNREVSFMIRPGEIVGMAGLVGAGRSEVAEALFGVVPALGGEVLLDKVPVRIKSTQEAIKNGLALVPEDRRRTGLIVEDSIRSNVSLPALQIMSRLGLVQGNVETRTAQEVKEQLGVKAPNVEVAARNLSGGNQQKVALGKWLARKPRVFIFDEPTRGVDVGAKAEIYTLMRRLAVEGASILMISSDMEEVLAVSDRILVMSEGSLTGELTEDHISEENVMALAVAGQQPVVA